MSKIVSLFDYTGIWSQPYADAGYEVIKIDIQNGRDIWEEKIPNNIHGIIIQPPCDHFANSGARWFLEKDEDGRTYEAIALVKESIRWIILSKPKWWVLENPAGRIHKLVPWLGDPVYKFSPHEFGEEYRKTTWLWGTFNHPKKLTPNAQIIGRRPGQPDEWYSKVGGKSIQTKNYRSATSKLFATEFFKANP
jgi:C-5 cytosine-specific DNA methylase